MFLMRDCPQGGELYGLPASERIGKGKLSSCFKRNGNYLCMVPQSPFALSHHSQNPVMAPHPIHLLTFPLISPEQALPNPFHNPAMTPTSLPVSCHSAQSPFILPFPLISPERALLHSCHNPQHMVDFFPSIVDSCHGAQSCLFTPKVCKEPSHNLS